MNLNEFRHNDFIMTDCKMVKVVRNDTLKAIDKNGTAYDVGLTASRVVMNISYLKRVPGFAELTENNFVLSPMPGRISYNYTDLQYEWIVGGITIRTLEFLDELQGLFFYTTGKELF